MSLARFPQDEYESRLARVRARMSGLGADALVAADPANIAWLTGYDGWSFYVPQCAVVPPEGEPLWWGRGIDAAGARRTAWMRDENIFGYSDDLVHNPPRHPADDLAAMLREKGLASAAVGVGMDSHFFTAACFSALRRGLPRARFVDAEAAVNWARAAKSPRELALMENAARIAEKIHARIREVIARARWQVINLLLLRNSSLNITGPCYAFLSRRATLVTIVRFSTPYPGWDTEQIITSIGEREWAELNLKGNCKVGTLILIYL